MLTTLLMSLAAAQEAVPSVPAALQGVRGRKIWMVGAPPEDCRRVEQELGLSVDCDTDWGGGGTQEIVIWCPEIPHTAAPAILSFLGKDSFNVRTHQTNPAATSTNECGELYEITVRY